MTVQQGLSLGRARSVPMLFKPPCGALLEERSQENIYNAIIALSFREHKNQLKLYYIVHMTKIGWFVLGDAPVETAHLNSLHKAIFS